MRYLLLAWVIGALAIYAAPDGLSTLGYLAVAALVAGVTVGIYWMAQKSRRA